MPRVQSNLCHGIFGGLLKSEILAPTDKTTQRLCVLVASLFWLLFENSTARSGELLVRHPCIGVSTPDGLPSCLVVAARD